MDAMRKEKLGLQLSRQKELQRVRSVEATHANEEGGWPMPMSINEARDLQFGRRGFRDSANEKRAVIPSNDIK